jgi:hypothetical protein
MVRVFGWLVLLGRSQDPADRARADAVQPQVPGQQPRKRGDHRPVGPVRLRSGDTTAEDRDLMPQAQDLHVFGGVAAR